MSDSVTAPTTGEREPFRVLLDAFEEAANNCGVTCQEHERGHCIDAELERAVQKESSARVAVEQHYDALRADIARKTGESDDQRRRAIDAESDAYEVREQLATAQREAAGLQADAKRLDWMESQRRDSGAIWILPCGDTMTFTQVRMFGDVENYPTVKGNVRDAIDAAMSSLTTETPTDA